ncbi:MAG: SPOR domain-containing protein [Crocinitomicaceae bacterium]
MDTLSTVFRPRIGLGVGTMAYYGEIQNYQRKFVPTVSRYYGTAYVNFPMTKYFNAEFSASYGKISANERTLTRNLNFESRIRMAGVQLFYNFHPFLKAQRSLLHPFIGVGFTSFEFLSKTDLYDANGNQYYYWSDGSIMNVDEDSPLASSAVELSRDYTYETDLREQNLDSLGDYREQSFAIPFTIGSEWHLSPRWDFRVASTFYLTFTDLIDNISQAGQGPERHGDGYKDKLWTTYVSLSYDLQLPRKDINDPLGDEGIELYADFEQNDWDQDGVIDALDECADTPLEALVDEKGCPLDGDGDGVPDYRDDELATPDGNYVDEFGVTMTEEDIAKHWREFNDSTGYEHDFVENKMVVEFGGDRIPQLKDPYADKKTDLSYVIIIGKEQKDISANELHEYLGYNDFKTETRGDTVYYILGEYEKIENAVAAKNALTEKGINVELIARDGSDKTTYVPVDDQVIEKVDQANIKNGVENPDIEEKTDLFRVQLGAFKKKVDTDKLFPGVEITEATGKDGITRYYTGVYEEYDDADDLRKKMIGKGYKSAFVVAYKGAKRVTLPEAGVNPEDLPDNYNEDNEIASFVEPRDTSSTTGPNNNTFDMSQVKFRVLLTSTTSDLSNEELDILSNIGNVKVVKEFDGSFKYYSQQFENKEEAIKGWEGYKEYGLDNMSIIYEYDGEFLTEEEFKAKTNQ